VPKGQRIRSYIPRRKWNPQVGPRPFRMALPKAEVNIHHSVTNEPGAENGHKDVVKRPSRGATFEEEATHMRLIEQIGISQGHGGISYSFVAFDSGRVWEGQGWGTIGAHTFNRNSISHGICAAGNFMTDRPTDALKQGIRRLLRRGRLRRKLTGGPIKVGRRLFGHRDHGASGGGTACPGTHLYNALRDLEV
jgi:hypothetical protein